MRRRRSARNATTVAISSGVPMRPGTDAAPEILLGLLGWPDTILKRRIDESGANGVNAHTRF